MVRILITVLSFKKTSKNHQNQSDFRIHLFSEVFVFFKLGTINEILTIYRLLTHILTRQSSLDRHPYWVVYDKVEIAMF